MPKRGRNYVSSYGQKRHKSTPGQAGNVSKKRLSARNKSTVRNMIYKLSGDPKQHTSVAKFNVNTEARFRHSDAAVQPHHLLSNAAWLNGTKVPVSSHRPVAFGLLEMEENYSGLAITNPTYGDPSSNPNSRKQYFKWINLRMRFTCGETATIFRMYLVKPRTNEFYVNDFAGTDLHFVNGKKYQIKQQWKWVMEGYQGSAPAHWDQDQRQGPAPVNEDPEQHIATDGGTRMEDKLTKFSQSGPGFKMMDLNLKIDKMMYNKSDFGLQKFPNQDSLFLVVVCSDPYGTVASISTEPVTGETAPVYRNDTNICAVEMIRRLTYTEYE